MKTVVVHTGDIERAVEFFRALGLKFSEQQHGSGPRHFAHEGPDGRVFEIYPLTSRWPQEALRVID